MQIQLNYLDWENPQGNFNKIKARVIYEELSRCHMPVVIMEPILGGRLAKPHYKVQELLKQKEPENTAASWAFRFAGSFPDVVTVLSGMVYMEDLQDNIRTYSPLKPISPDEHALLMRCAKMMVENPNMINISCTNCKYCMPCPYGVNIPGVFAHYNTCLNEGNFPLKRQDPGYHKARMAFLTELDRSVETLRQANHCIGCGNCLKECPQHIPIPDEMKRIDRFVEQLKRDTEG